MKGQTNNNKEKTSCTPMWRTKYVQTKSGVVCKIKNDESVSRLIKHNKKNEKIEGVIKVAVSWFCMLFSVVFFSVLCVTVFNSVYYKLKPTFLGYTTCRVVTASMTNSGFEINDKAIVRAVDTSTLRGARLNEKGEKIWGDIIAFYVDPNNSTDVKDFKKVTDFDYDVKYVGGINTIFRIPSAKLKQLAKNKATIFFHHIEDVYVDDSGKRWFSTRGSSNLSIDQEKITTNSGVRYLNSGYVSEDVILGVYDQGVEDDGFARVVANIAESKATIPVLFVVSILLLIVGLSDVFMLIISYYYTAKLLNGTLSPTDEKIKTFRVYDNLSDYEKLQILQDFPVEQSSEILANLFVAPQEDDFKKEGENKKKLLDKDYKSKNPNYNELKKIYAKKRIQLLMDRQKSPKFSKK